MVSLSNQKFKYVHFVGIGGIGVSAIAKMMIHQGVAVTGSDAVKTEITDELQERGVKIFYEHKAANLPEKLDLLIYSAAVPEDNPERAKARSLGVGEMSYFDFLGELSKQYFTIAVSGTNGKSTTTAMLGLILEAAGLDPTVIVGSKVKTFPDGNLRLGTTSVITSPPMVIGGRGNLPIFVVEACEYNAHMLKLSPQMIVLTNIEEDHLDYYQDLEHIKNTFAEYTRKLSEGGTLIYNSDDVNTEEVVSSQQSVVGLNKFSYGIDLPADHIVKNIFIDSGRQHFSILRTNKHEEIIGNFSLQIPGRFNIYNAMAAATAALALNVDPAIIKKTFEEFSGIWRRFEKVGERDGAIIISDYGHHPTAIKETVRAAREFYPNRRIVLVYQPHQRNRTRKLFAEFTHALQTPDILVLSEIYDVTGREVSEDKNVSSLELFDEITKSHSRHPDFLFYFAQNLEEAERITKEIIKPNNLVIVMGAGDIDKVARRLI